MRIAKHQKLKNRYIIASLMIVFGIALVFMGGSKALFPDSIYEYESLGVILKNETLKQFNSSPIRIIGETHKEFQQRLHENRSRINEVYKLSDEYMGESFIENTSLEKRRVYELKSSSKLHSNYNDVLIAFGLILILGGGFTMNYVYQFKE